MFRRSNERKMLNNMGRRCEKPSFDLFCVPVTIVPPTQRLSLLNPPILCCFSRSKTTVVSIQINADWKYKPIKCQLLAEPTVRIVRLRRLTTFNRPETTVNKDSLNRSIRIIRTIPKMIRTVAKMSRSCSCHDE
jgi:hypothetical protein